MGRKSAVTYGNSRRITLTPGPTLDLRPALTLRRSLLLAADSSFLSRSFGLPRRLSKLGNTFELAGQILIDVVLVDDLGRQLGQILEHLEKIASDQLPNGVLVFYFDQPLAEQPTGKDLKALAREKRSANRRPAVSPAAAKSVFPSFRRPPSPRLPPWRLERGFERVNIRD